MTSTTACILETTLTFHSILSARFRVFRGRAQPVLSITASVAQQARKEPTMVQGDAPHPPPFGVFNRRLHMSFILFDRALSDLVRRSKVHNLSNLSVVISQGCYVTHKVCLSECPFTASGDAGSLQRHTPTGTTQTGCLFVIVQYFHMW